jgi:hypothetical protein
MNKAPATLDWHGQQKARALKYKPKKPEISGDYVGGGPLTGSTAVPPLPPGTARNTKESFVSESGLPRSWWIMMAVAGLSYVVLTSLKLKN